MSRFITDEEMEEYRHINKPRTCLDCGNKFEILHWENANLEYCEDCREEHYYRCANCEKLIVDDEPEIKDEKYLKIYYCSKSCFAEYTLQEDAYKEDL